MKKIILTLIFLLSLSSVSFAVSYKMKVRKTDGTVILYDADKVSQVTYPSTSEMLITFTDNTTASYQVSNVAQVYFGEEGDLAPASVIASQMYPGWNLGNTMEAGSNSNNWTNNGGTAAEISWQSTTTTQAIIDKVKSMGFKSVRIPCSWVMGHITDTNNCTIDASWMARVKEIVDYCIKDGLFVIINDHWDGGWLEDEGFSTSVDVTTKTTQLKKIWTQIATEFKDYDEHLLFAGLNEPAEGDGYTVSNYISELQTYEQAFIDAVRATGSKNATRTLIVQGPETNIDKTIQYFDVTKLSDTQKGRLMVEVHYYDPYYFTMMEADGTSSSVKLFWGSTDGVSNHVSPASSTRNCPTTYEEAYVNSQFAKMKSSFCDKGYPVIIGEYGACWRKVDGFTNSRYQTNHDASIQSYYKAINQYAINNGCIPFAWDTNSLNYTSAGSMSILNRSTLAIYDTCMANGVTNGVSASVWPY
jgi:endoglucanase